MSKERFLTIMVPITDGDCEATVYASVAALQSSIPASEANKDKIYKISDGTFARSVLTNGSYSYMTVESREFPYLGDPMEIRNFTYDATRMGSAPTLTSQSVMRFAEKDSANEDFTIDSLWSRKCHVVFNGEKMYLYKAPNAEKSNDDARYKYDMTFVSDISVIENVYIYDTVYPYAGVKPVSDGYSFSFFGDVSELVKRINASLLKSGLASLERKYVPYPTSHIITPPSGDVPYLTFEQWNVMGVAPLSLVGSVFGSAGDAAYFRMMIYDALGSYSLYLLQYIYASVDGEFVTSGMKCVLGVGKDGLPVSSEEKLVTFDKNTIHDALQEIHDTYELQYYVTRNGGDTLFVVGDCEHDFADIDPLTGDYVRDADGTPMSTRPFDYGAVNEFLSKGRNNSTDKIVTRITGVGSAENIPWYYPNPNPDGWLKAVFKRNGNTVASTTVDYPEDEGDTEEENERYQKFLKNRIGRTICRGRVTMLRTGTSYTKMGTSFVGGDAVYAVFTFFYPIEVKGLALPVMAFKLSYNASQSRCSKFVARLYRNGAIAFDGDAVYDSSETYSEPNLFQQMCMAHDGSSSASIVPQTNNFFKIEYYIPLSDVPATKRYDYEGYRYQATTVNYDGDTTDKWIVNPLDGVTYHHTYTVASAAHVGENFYQYGGLVAFAVWSENTYWNELELTCRHTIYPVKAGYSTDGTNDGETAPIPRVKDKFYKDVTSGIIYVCKTSGVTDVITGDTEAVFDSNVKMGSEEWLREFVSLDLRVYESQGWYINGKRVYLDDYGIDGPNVSGDVYHPTVFDTIEFQRVKWLNTAPRLMPELYFKTDGERRFYEAHNYWDKDSSELYAGVADTDAGEEQVGNKVRNPIYKENETDADSAHYDFENEYDMTCPYERIDEIDDVKPTIKGQTNTVGGVALRIDVVEEFGYDASDNDEIWEPGDGGANGEYKHPYFFAKLRPLGFNIFDMALQDDMVLSFNTGHCGSCKFKIGVDENTGKNPVQTWRHNVYRGETFATKGAIVYAAGTLRRYIDLSGLYYDTNGTADGYIPVLQSEGFTGGGTPVENFPSMFYSYTYSEEDVANGFVGSSKQGAKTHFEGDVVTSGRFIESQQDTTSGYVWAALMKDTDTYGRIMPSVATGMTPKSFSETQSEDDADKFVLTEIALPYVFLRKAERELSKRLVKSMYESNFQKFNFPIKFSGIFLDENPSVERDVNENCVIYVRFDRKTYRQYVKHYTYTMREDAPLPTITVEMNEELSASRSLTGRTRRAAVITNRGVTSYVDTAVQSAIGRASTTVYSSMTSTSSYSSSQATVSQVGVDPEDTGGLVQKSTGISLMMSSPSSNGSMSSEQFVKLDGVEEGAQKNVQSDWSQSDASADDYIKNKPSLPSVMTDAELKAGVATEGRVVSSKLLKDNFDIQGRTVTMRETSLEVPEDIVWETLT